MLGSFQYFFVEQGLFQESFLTIWMHGALEISAIVIAGAAGITVGRGLAFPGTLPRVRSFQLAARRGMTIFVGVLPLLLIAGFIEGFFTRFTDAPDILRGLFIFVCFAFVYSYYWWYPKQRASLAFKSSLDSINPNPEIKRAVDFSRIKTTGELFTDTFLFLRTHIKKIFWAAFTGASIYALGAFFGTDVTPRELFDLGGGFFLNGFVLLPDFFNNIYHPWLSVLMIGVMGAVAFVVQFQLTRIAEKQQKTPSLFQVADSSRFFESLGSHCTICALGGEPILGARFTHSIRLPAVVPCQSDHVGGKTRLAHSAWSHFRFDRRYILAHAWFVSDLAALWCAILLAHRFVTTLFFTRHGEFQFV